MEQDETTPAGDTVREMMELPSAFFAADEASQGAQRRFFTATKIRLALLVFAAGFGTFSFRPGGETDVFAIAAAAAFLGAMGAELFLLQTRPEQSWYQGRAAAESVKTLAWRYAVGGEPFRVDLLGPAEADRILIGRLRSVLLSLHEIDFSAAGCSDEQITADMRRIRSQPLEERRRLYDVDRLAEQQRWYAAKARWNAKRAHIWSAGTVLIEIAGGLAAVVKVSRDLNWLSTLLSVVATFAAVLAGWTQSKQYSTLATSYGLAAQELSSNRALTIWQADEPTWAQFVRDAEDAISREHTTWRANRGLRMPADGQLGDGEA